MELKMLGVQQIKPYKNNPRKNDQAVDAVVESIQQCGYIAPIIVDENHVILAGHTRYKAILRLGHREVMVIVKEGLTEEQKRKYRLLDNKVGELADWDVVLLEQELNGLDFGKLELDWDIGAETAKAIDLDDIPTHSAPEAETMHCPKCGYVFEVKK